LTAIASARYSRDVGQVSHERSARLRPRRDHEGSIEREDLGMFGYLRRLFGRRRRPEFTEAEYEAFDEAKQAALERLLGPMHDVVGHSLIPFGLGGSVSLFYFTEGIEGTAIATMELIGPDGRGPHPSREPGYELVAFTRQQMPEVLQFGDGETGRDESPFERIKSRLGEILTAVAQYGSGVDIASGDTCEIPGNEDAGVPGACLILATYPGDGPALRIGGMTHELMACIEIHRDEMLYAMNHGGVELLARLEEHGHFPYSDLDRPSVV
jgi:hypothetical protein